MSDLKTKISAAAKDFERTDLYYWKQQCIKTSNPTLEPKSNQEYFTAGANFAIGEVRELLIGCRDALDKIKEECLDEKQVMDVIYDVHSMAIGALKKIDDSGALTEETMKEGG